MKAVENAARRAAFPVVMVFALLALGIVVDGAFYYRNCARHFPAEVERRLSVIVKLNLSNETSDSHES